MMPKMAQRYSPDSMLIMELAGDERSRLHHPYLGGEHVLLGVLAHASNPAAEILNDRGLELATARAGIARIVSQSGSIALDDAALLSELGVDVARMRLKLELTFGGEGVDEAARQVRRRPWWRGRAHSSPICGPPYLIKRAQFIACTTAGKRGEAEIRPEHLLHGVLRTARDPLGSGLGRRSRHEVARLGLRVGAPHPVRLLLAERGIDLGLLEEDLLDSRTTT